MLRITTFQELMKGLPRSTFDQVVKKRNADKYSKKFGHWDHLIAMLYAQLSDTSGLRPLETAFNNHRAHHYHLGTDCIKRTTLADANNKRGDGVFSDTVGWLMGQVSRQLRRDTGELKYLLDSTSITLKGREFDDWTLDNRTRNTQGIKLHVLLDAKSKVPDWYCFSAANVNDVEKALEVPLQKDALYIFDKGYCSYSWWHQIDTAGARFVTRFKSNAGLVLELENPIPADAAGFVLKDHLVRFKHARSGGKNNPCKMPLRSITVVRPNKKPLVLATNDLTSPAMEIAQRYKERWDIALFFKWIKQHLKIKKFLGRSENAVRIQILTALISYLLVAIYKQRHALQGSLWDCLCRVRATLFQRPETEESQYRRRKQDSAWMAEIQPSLFP